MPESTDSFRRRLMARLVNTAALISRPRIPARTLRDAMRPEVLNPGEGRLYIPHYWAVYVHEGRGAPFGARSGRFLVWFRDPNLDPRLPGGRTPERARDLRRLTQGEFRFWLNRNRLAIAKGLPPPMIIRLTVRKPTPPIRFFGNNPGEGLASFPPTARRIIGEEFSDFVKDFMGDDLNVRDGCAVKL